MWIDAPARTASKELVEVDPPVAVGHDPRDDHIGPLIGAGHGRNCTDNARCVLQDGLDRLELYDSAFLTLSPATMMPAVAQGALGIEGRVDDPLVQTYVEALDDQDSHRRVHFDPPCQRPLGFADISKVD